MKSVLLASALMISGVAFAQADPRDAGQPIGSGATLQPGTTMGERDTMGPQATVPPAPAQSSTMVPAPAPAPADATMPPPPPADTTAMPADTTAMPPAGTTGSGTMVVQEGGNMTAPPAPKTDYPRCSRTVTDGCVQDRSREADTKGGRPRR